MKEKVSEIEIYFANEIQEGEMRALSIGPKDEDKVLIAKYQGNLHSVGNFCTHFGAPLNTGVLFDDKVKCPWHVAAFSIVTGQVEGGPAMNSIPVFEIIKKNGKSFVKIPNPLPGGKPSTLAKRDPANK